MKKLVLLLCALFFFNHVFAQQDTIPVYFATGRSVLTEGVQNQIIENIYNDVLHNGQPLQIVGYADYVGGNRYNDQLSKARAATVKRFLLKYGFEDKNITICIGKGEVERQGMKDKNGFAHDRRVDIVTNAGPAVPPAEPLPPLNYPAAKPDEKPVVKIPDISTMKPNETLVLDKIYFYPGRHVIRPESAAALDKLYAALREHPAVKIGIEGHVCCVRNGVADAIDDDTHELNLSANRARAIYLYLVKKGIGKERLSYKGFGATHRIAEETTEEEADKNRRVELRILE